FDKARGKAMGFAYLGIGIGGAIVFPLSNWLSGRFGWRGALMTLGILVICIALPMVLLVGQSPDGHSRAKREPAVPIGGVLKGVPFYLLAVASMCSIGAVGGTNQNLKLYLTLDCGYGQAESAWLGSIVLTSSLLGRLLMGWLADRFPKKYVMLLIYSLVAGSVCLLLVSSSPGAVYSFAVIFGIGLGGDYMIIPLMAGELFGINALGRVMGIILTADGVGEALVPMIVARMRDQSGSYASGLLFLASLAVTGAIVVALLPRADRSGSIPQST